MKCMRMRCVKYTKIFHTIENDWYDEIWYKIHTGVASMNSKTTVSTIFVILVCLFFIALLIYVD